MAIGRGRGYLPSTSGKSGFSFDAGLVPVQLGGYSVRGNFRR